MDRQEENGSITVFLVFLFLLFFSLVGVTLENARVLSSQGYVRTAAHSAAMTVFGNYNRELYDAYGLFAYGGYGGRGAYDLAEEYTDILRENLKASPDTTLVSYSNLYRIDEISGSVSQAGYLSEEDILYEQMKACVKESALQSVKEKLTGENSDETEETGYEQKLSMAQDYENGAYDEADAEGESEQKSEAGAAEEDAAGGNPLECFTDLVRMGVLRLVCDATRLSDETIEGAEDDSVSGQETEDAEESTGAAAFLQQLLTQPEEETEEEGLAAGALSEKPVYITYANEMFSYYGSDQGRAEKYGIEYLIAGNAEEQENLSAVVNRLLRIRLLVNFACIAADADLQEKSLATATVIAGAVGIPAVIRAVQYVILMILAFEEACVDVTALLAGKAVPLTKTAGDLKMKYSEICAASKALFAAKAEEYSEEEKTGAITYQKYLWLFLQGCSTKTLHLRSCNLIQDDLRKQYNQTFTIGNCICESSYTVSYRVPYVFQNLPYLTGRTETGSTRSLEVFYAYKSE